MTADFQRVYGVRLVDAVENREVQEIIDLITWLPPDSALKASVRAKGDPTKALSLFQWGAPEVLMLAQVNLLREVVWVTAQVNSKKNITRPEPISGPDDKPNTGGSRGDANSMARALLSAARKG